MSQPIGNIAKSICALQGGRQGGDQIVLPISRLTTNLFDR